MIDSTLLPFITEMPLEETLIATDAVDALDWRTPQRAQTHYMRVIVEAVRFLLRSAGVAPPRCRLVGYALRATLVRMAANDLGFIPKLDDCNKRILQLSLKQYAYVATKLGRQGLLNASQLAVILIHSSVSGWVC